MAKRSPPRLSNSAMRSRRNRIARIARQLGFVGRIEYRHVYSQAGGAQYGQARLSEDDLLIVYAEAFDRDANSDDFSLEAILAHECGHQILARHPRIARLVAGQISLRSEEILASVIGASLCTDIVDEEHLLSKATVDLIVRGEDSEIAARQIQQLQELMEALL